MDKTSAYGNALSAAKAALAAAKDLLPNEIWGDNADGLERAAAESLQEVIELVNDLEIPV